MTKFLLISEDSEKECILREVFPTDEIIVSSDNTMIFDVLKVEEPDIVIVDEESMNIDTVFAMGKIVVERGKAIVKGTFE